MLRTLRFSDKARSLAIRKTAAPLDNGHPLWSSPQSYASQHGACSEEKRVFPIRDADEALLTRRKRDACGRDAHVDTLAGFAALAVTRSGDARCCSLPSGAVPGKGLAPIPAPVALSLVNIYLLISIG